MNTDTINEMYVKVHLLTHLVSTFPNSNYVYAAVRYVGYADSIHYRAGTSDEFGIFYPHTWTCSDKILSHPRSANTYGKDMAKVFLFKCATAEICPDLKLLTDVIRQIEDARDRWRAPDVLAMVADWVGYFLENSESGDLRCLDAESATILPEKLRVLKVLHLPGSSAEMVYDPRLPFSLESAVRRAAATFEIGDWDDTLTSHSVTDLSEGYLFAIHHLESGKVAGYVCVTENYPLGEEVCDVR